MHLSATWKRCTAVFMAERVDVHTYKNIKPPQYIWCATITKFILVAPKSRARWVGCRRQNTITPCNFKKHRGPLCRWKFVVTHLC